MNNENVVQAMPSVQELVTSEYTNKHWLQYYLNIWTRNAIALAIDIQCDKTTKAINPETEVEHIEENQKFIIPVKIRLEKRKIKLQDYLDIIQGIKDLIAISDDEFESQIFSKEALAVDEDMIPKEVDTNESTLEDQSVPVANFKVVAEAGITTGAGFHAKGELFPETELDTPVADDLLEKGDIIVA